MLLAQRAHKDALVADGARELFAARYDMPEAEVCAMCTLCAARAAHLILTRWMMRCQVLLCRQFVKACVLVLQASERRKADAVAEFKEELHEARMAFKASQREQLAARNDDAGSESKGGWSMRGDTWLPTACG